MSGQSALGLPATSISLFAVFTNEPFSIHQLQLPPHLAIVQPQHLFELEPPDTIITQVEPGLQAQFPHAHGGYASLQSMQDFDKQRLVEPYQDIAQKDEVQGPIEKHNILPEKPPLPAAALA